MAQNSKLTKGNIAYSEYILFLVIYFNSGEYILYITIAQFP